MPGMNLPFAMLLSLGHMTSTGQIDGDPGNLLHKQHCGNDLVQNGSQKSLRQFQISQNYIVQCGRPMPTVQVKVLLTVTRGILSCHCFLSYLSSAPIHFTPAPCCASNPPRLCNMLTFLYPEGNSHCYICKTHYLSLSLNKAHCQQGSSWVPTPP